MGFFNKLKIGTKVAMASGLGIVLMLVMVVGSSFVLGGVKQSVTEASDEASVARLLTGANEALQAMRVTSRDIRLAQKAKAIPDLDAAAGQEMAEINEMITQAIGLMDHPEDVDRANRILEQSQAYRDEVGKLAKLVSDELSMGLATAGVSLNRQKLIDSLLTIANSAVALSDEGVTGANERAAVTKTAAEATIDQVVLVNMVLGALVLIVLAFSLFFILRSVARPIRGITASMNTLAEGQLDEAIPYTSRGDEIGEMAAAVKVFQVNAVKVREMNDAEAIRTGQTRERAASMTQLMDGLAECSERRRRWRLHPAYRPLGPRSGPASGGQERQRSSGNRRCRNQRDRRGSGCARTDRSDPPYAGRVSWCLCQAQGRYQCRGRQPL